MTEAVRIHGRTIPGGFFLGEDIAAASSTQRLEPALISPSLPVASSRPDVHGQMMGYWPSYSSIEPESRAAYLDWLAAGRPSGAYVGYVFLFFYGIERKLLLEERTEANSAERDQLLAEVRRLLSLYPESDSFQGFASDLVSTINLRDGSLTTDDLTPPSARTGWDIPLEVKLAVGAFSKQGSPIPSDWALSWTLTNRDIRLKTPAKRCEAEFGALFKNRYEAKYGEGIIVPPGNSILEWEYKPASASFWGANISITAPGVADVARDETSVQLLRDIATEATEDLSAYSRYIVKNDANSPIAISLLPPELAASRAPEAVSTLAGQIEPKTIYSIPSTQLVDWIDPGKDHLTKKEAIAVSSLLASFGLAIEPDIRFGTANFSKGESVVVWKLDDPLADAGDGFLAATALMHLGAIVSASDGEVTQAEQSKLEESIENALDLPPSGRVRLKAHLEWLLVEQPGNTGIKTRTKDMSDEQRAQVARFMLAIAAADGHVSPPEVDALKRLYKLLGLDSESIHRDLHSMASAEPVEVITQDADPGDFRIPDEPTEASKGFDLNRERLANVISSTDEVRDILTSVFTDVQEPTETEPELEPASEAENTIAGLDQIHSEFVWLVSTQPRWAAADLDEIAKDLGLMRAGAIEQVNEAAFDLCDAPLLEGSDPVEIDPYVVKEMMNA